MTNAPIATDRLVANLTAPATGQRLVWDGTVPGFGVRVTANGSKSFILDYRARGGIQRRLTIGSAADWKVAAARRHASQLRKAVDLGADPVGEDKAAREAVKAEAARRKTVDQLADCFEAEHLPSLRPATQKFYRLALKNHIRPALGRKEVEQVQRNDVEAMHAKLTAKGQRHQANQCAVLCGVLFRYAIKWGWRSGDNPAREVTRHTLEGRERYLTPDETRRLSAAIDKLADRQAAAIFTVLLLCGSRVGETLKMRWSDIDFRLGLWTKPASTTKQKKVHRLPLTAPVLALLADLHKSRDHGQPFVFPGLGKSGHRTDLRLPWMTALKAARIDALRIHDLRHSLASTLAGAGYSLPMIGAALGHSRVETTNRYAHLADDPLRAAMERATQIIEAAARNEPAEIVTLRK